MAKHRHGPPRRSQGPKLKTRLRQVWFARGGGIARMGPYRDQAEASKALMTPGGFPIEGAFVWPEFISGPVQT